MPSSPICSACRKRPAIAGSSMCPTCIASVEEHVKGSEATRAQVRKQLADKKPAAYEKHLPPSGIVPFKPFEERVRDSRRSHFARDSDHGYYLVGTEHRGAIVYSIRAMLTLAEATGYDLDQIVADARSDMRDAKLLDEQFEREGPRKMMVDSARAWNAAHEDRKKAKKSDF